jgi:hypothetical protein
VTAKMTVVYLKDTGHVVAAVAESDAGEPTLEQIVGEAFPLRAVGRKGKEPSFAIFELPAVVLKTKSFALDLNVIARPQGFVVADDQVGGLAIPMAPPEMSSLKESQIKVKLSATDTAPSDLNVLAIVRGSESTNRDAQRVSAGSIKENETDVDMSLTVVPESTTLIVPKGAYAVAIAVAGYPLFYGVATV